MHRGTLIASLLASLSLAGCAHEPTVPTRADFVWAASCAVGACAQPLTVPVKSDMVWSLSRPAGEDAVLRVGAPRDGAELLALSCEPHAGDVAITVRAPARPVSSVVMSSDRQRARYNMELGWGPADEPILSGATRAGDPVLTRFAETGQLVLTTTGQGQLLPVEPEKAAKFLAICRR